MQRNILEYLEQTASRFPDKTAFANEQMGMTFQEVHQAARNIGTCLARKGYTKEPVVIYMKKHPHMITAFWGVVYSGCFYVPMDEEMPEYRISLIFDNLHVLALIVVFILTVSLSAGVVLLASAKVATAVAVL